LTKGVSRSILSNRATDLLEAEDSWLSAKERNVRDVIVPIGSELTCTLGSPNEIIGFPDFCEVHPCHLRQIRFRGDVRITSEASTILDNFNVVGPQKPTVRRHKPASFRALEQEYAQRATARTALHLQLPGNSQAQRNDLYTPNWLRLPIRMPFALMESAYSRIIFSICSSCRFPSRNSWSSCA